MSNESVHEVAHRLIGRDQAIRAGGKAPPWGAVQKTLEFVCQQNLLADPVVASWLRTLAGGADFWFSYRLLEVVGTLLNGQHADQSHTLYRLILGLDDAARWETVVLALVTNGMIVEAAIGPILGRAGLLVRHPHSWGQTACELLGRIVCEHQKTEWHSHLSIRALFAEKFGEPFNADQPFEPHEDDSPTLWYFAPDRPYSPRALLAAAVDRGVREAAQLPEAELFQLFTGWLLEQGFAVGSGMALAALLDGLTGKLAAQPWHADEAARLLALDQIQRPLSLSGFRQLLRRALPRPDVTAAAALTDVIRRSKLPESARLRELGDAASWGTLTPEEQTRLAEVSARDELDPPTDPRVEPIFHRGEPTRLPPSVDGRVWPHPEDSWAVEELSSMHREQEPQQEEAIDYAKLDRRLQALQALIEREARDSEGWRGEILGWCQRCVLLLRREELIHLGRDPNKGTLSASEWEDLLATRAPWWRGRAEAAIIALAAPVPAYHQERRPGGLSWSTSDPILQSLAYLDSVLAVDGEGSFAPLRAQMERVIDEAWPEWPGFTRATVLSVLRPWYWHHLGRLRNRLTELVAQESDPLALRYAVGQLLRIGGPDFAANLGRFLARAPQIESSGEMVNQLGRAIGHAYLCAQDQPSPGEGVRQLAELCMCVQQAPPEHPATREELIRGFLFGALDLFKDRSFRTQSRADAWASLVVWSCSVWPWTQDMADDRDHFPVLPVMAALAPAWPEGLRRRMFDVLQKPFLHIFQEGTLADYCWMHYEVGILLRGDGQGPNSQVVPLKQGDLSDEHLLEFCRASAQRVASWRRSGKSTRDIGWAAALTGQATAELIRAVVEAGSDRNYLRRELPPIIDRLAEFGAPGIATELRLLLRRN